MTRWSALLDELVPAYRPAPEPEKATALAMASPYADEF